MTDTPTTTPPLVVIDNPDHHRYQATVDGHVAVAIYSLAGATITFIHTLVPEALQGRGIASRLVTGALASVRERGLKVIPQCPVFAAYMKKHAEVQDLLAPEGRALLGL
jgi:predicted GNAT family acetyltransferase